MGLVNLKVRDVGLASLEKFQVVANFIRNCQAGNPEHPVLSISAKMGGEEGTLLVVYKGGDEFVAFFVSQAD